ncbi:MAG: septum formation protein Maf [Flavobacteriaceae bacterium]|nr:septum formation protein Maf [Flavobacteriaceae bacterium]|tara:strand:- start:239977 stop:240561 length:585 start_codon:yes stop_codon:yes gene_type:complete
MLAEKFEGFEIILASKSPRRQELFKTLGLDFKVMTKDVPEVYPDSLSKQEITSYLSELKSNAFGGLQDHQILITADTIVWQNNKALEKPANEKEAYYMLNSLQGRTHEVITSFCIRTTAYRATINDTTLVHFNELSSEEMEFYIKNYKPFDKAGAYGIQEWIGFIGIHKIEGSYFNVVGLPVHKLYKELKNLKL